MKNYREIPFALVPYSQEHHHKFVCLVLTMVVMFQLRGSIVMLNGSDGKVKDVRGTIIWDGLWEVIFWREYLMDLALIQFFLKHLLFALITTLRELLQKIASGTYSSRYVFSRKCNF